MVLKKRIIEIIYQIIPVMIGVYLGFALSNWSENKKLDKKQEVFLSSFKKEIKSNKETILKIKDYHKLVRDSSSYYINQLDSISFNNAPKFFQGLRTQTLSETVYNSGITSGILTHINLETTQKIGHLHNLQESYNNFNSIALQGFINLEFEDSKKSMKRALQYLLITMSDLSNLEEILIKEYNKVENKL